MMQGVSFRCLFVVLVHTLAGCGAAETPEDHALRPPPPQRAGEQGQELQATSEPTPAPELILAPGGSATPEPESPRMVSIRLRIREAVESMATTLPNSLARQLLEELGLWFQGDPDALSADDEDQVFGGVVRVLRAVLADFDNDNDVELLLIVEYVSDGHPGIGIASSRQAWTYNLDRGRPSSAGRMTIYRSDLPYIEGERHPDTRYRATLLWEDRNGDGHPDMVVRRKRCLEGDYGDGSTGAPVCTREQAFFRVSFFEPTNNAWVRPPEELNRWDHYGAACGECLL